MIFMRSKEQIIAEAKYCKEELENALQREDYLEALINQMALNNFLWVLKKDNLIMRPKPKKKSLKEMFFKKKENLDDVLEAKF